MAKSVITFAPIAVQLARLIPLDEIFPRAVVEDVVRAHREETLEPDQPELPDDVQHFFGHYAAVTRAAVQLLGLPAFERLARLHENIEEQYMPGGPPMSPVYDSFAMQFVLTSVPHGIGDETPYSVLARLLLSDPSRSRLQRMAQSLADARFELYRVKRADGYSAEIEPVRGGAVLSVRLTGTFLRARDFGLMRVLEFDEKFYIADSPYLLRASEKEWLEHLARVVAAQQSAAGAPGSSSSSKLGKLSKKEQARRRQKEKAKTNRKDPEAIVAHYFRCGLSENYWLDYIMDGYAGERSGMVFLAGVPDRPELLPHSPEFAGRGEEKLPRMAALREALMRLAGQEGLLERAQRELMALRDSAGAGAAEPSPNEALLLAAYATLGLRSEDGTTLLERFARAHEGGALGPEVRAALESIRRGWFSVFRVERIYLDEGLDVLDTLREKKLKISERSATRQLGLGDLLIGWVCQGENGTLTLEGALAHVPSLASEPLLSLVSTVRRAMPSLDDERAWKERAAELPPRLIAGMLELRANPPLPKLVNMSGDPLELVTAHYRILDRARVLEVLPRQFEETGDGSYTWLDAENTVLARLELAENLLRVHVNSRMRLKSAQQRVETLLGDAVKRSLEVHEDVQRAQREARKFGAKTERPDLPPELAAEFHQLVMEKLRSTLDAPIPQFRNKTLRELARSARGRPDAISWLRQQERLLKSNPQLAGIDLRPLWEELALPYQGLETDQKNVPV